MTGIPVSVVLEKYNGRKDKEEKHKFHDMPRPFDLHVEDELASEKDYVKSIENEFAGQAEGILERLQLSHLRLRPKKEVDE
jgi:hypothetical protein